MADLTAKSLQAENERPCEALRLTLVRVSFAAVEFIADLGNTRRVVSVVVGSGPSWFAASRFPNITSEGGETLGSPELDAEVRRRAGEELARLEGARRAA